MPPTAVRTGAACRAGCRTGRRRTVATRSPPTPICSRSCHPSGTRRRAARATSCSRRRRPPSPRWWPPVSAAGVPVVPTITDGDGPLVTARLPRRSGAARPAQGTIVNLVLVSGYEGIDIDYEGFAFNDGKANWPAIAAELGRVRAGLRREAARPGPTPDRDRAADLLRGQRQDRARVHGVRLGQHHRQRRPAADHDLRLERQRPRAHLTELLRAAHDRLRAVDRDPDGEGADGRAVVRPRLGHEADRQLPGGVATVGHEQGHGRARSPPRARHPSRIHRRAR